MKNSSLLLLAAFILGSVAPQVRAEPVPPTPAPAWKLKDLEGKLVDSERFKGKVVVIDFWATWCAPCLTEIPGYIALQKKYGKKGLVIVGISVDETSPSQIKQFSRKMGINYQIVMTDEVVTEAFGGVEVIPTTLIIDRSGNIRDKKVGAESTDEYEKRLVALLNEK
jgi:thiol-disulfide isomerase/thioredoxin